MKITLLEPLGIPAEVLEQYAAKLEAAGHTFTAYDAKTADPAELMARTGDSDIAIIANTPYPASVVEAAPQLKMLNVAFTGIDHADVEMIAAFDRSFFHYLRDNDQVGCDPALLNAFHLNAGEGEHVGHFPGAEPLQVDVTCEPVKRYVHCLSEKGLDVIGTEQGSGRRFR